MFTNYTSMPLLNLCLVSVRDVGPTWNRYLPLVNTSCFWGNASFFQLKLFYKKWLIYYCDSFNLHGTSRCRYKKWRSPSALFDSVTHVICHSRKKSGQKTVPENELREIYPCPEIINTECVLVFFWKISPRAAYFPMPWLADFKTLSVRKDALFEYCLALVQCRASVWDIGATADNFMLVG